MKIDWDVGGESNGIILLRMLMRRLPVTAQDLWLAERFDQIDESKPRIRKTGLGAIMQGHIDKQKVYTIYDVFYHCWSRFQHQGGAASLCLFSVTVLLGASRLGMFVLIFLHAFTLDPSKDGRLVT